MSCCTVLTADAFASGSNQIFVRSFTVCRNFINSVRVHAYAIVTRIDLRWWVQRES